MKRMRKCNDEVYQLAKDQALVNKIKNTKVDILQCQLQNT
jgi:hypothetical protein